MNVVIYTRYSSHNQTDQSTTGQLEVCKKFCKANNYTIVGEYHDKAKSVTKDDRDQFLQMIKDSEKGYVAESKNAFSRQIQCYAKPKQLTNGKRYYVNNKITK